MRRLHIWCHKPSVSDIIYPTHPRSSADQDRFKFCSVPRNPDYWFIYLVCFANNGGNFPPFRFWSSRASSYRKWLHFTRSRSLPIPRLDGNSYLNTTSYPSPFFGSFVLLGHSNTGHPLHSHSQTQPLKLRKQWTRSQRTTGPPSQPSRQTWASTVAGFARSC